MKVLARVTGALRVWFMAVRMARVEAGRGGMLGGTRRRRLVARVRGRRGRSVGKRSMVVDLGGQVLRMSDWRFRLRLRLALGVSYRHYGF